MKKYLFLFAMIAVLTLSATASAKPHDWSHSSYRHNNWHHVSYRQAAPFAWHESRGGFSSSYYRMERIYDHAWNKRFPGLYSYRWCAPQGHGFWYRGHYVKDAVLFYNRSDQLVSIGFMHNGVFVFLRDDDNDYENHDSFFLAWWNR